MYTSITETRQDGWESSHAISMFFVDFAICCNDLAMFFHCVSTILLLFVCSVRLFRYYFLFIWKRMVFLHTYGISLVNTKCGHYL